MVVPWLGSPGVLQDWMMGQVPCLQDCTMRSPRDLACCGGPGAVQLPLFCSSRLGCSLRCSLKTMTLPQVPTQPLCPLTMVPLDSVLLRWDQRDLSPG